MTVLCSPSATCPLVGDLAWPSVPMHTSWLRRWDTFLYLPFGEFPLLLEDGKTEACRDCLNSSAEVPYSSSVALDTRADGVLCSLW